MNAPIVKIGGSLVTVKSAPSAFALEQTRRLSSELAAYGGPLVLVHGTGSFGKPPARAYGFMDGFLPASRVNVVTRVEALLDELRALVLRALREAGLPAYPLSPAALFDVRDGTPEALRIEPVERLLARGAIPVLSGAVVPDEARGFAVLSSDTIAGLLAAAMRSPLLLFAGDTAGLLDGDRPLPVAHELEVSVSPTSGDVSGGMQAKLAAGFVAARAGVDVRILDGRVPGRVSDALWGRAVEGTRLLAAGAA